jgi:MoaA/NifB/PqqE/SkfB family radical SAM enzyme
MCGNHGDPMMAPEAVEILKWLKEINPKIRLAMNTNGGARRPTWWAELAKVIDHVTFSVDGLEDTNHLYRQGVTWERVEANMHAFCRAGGNAKWEFLVFKHNEHQIEEAELWAKALGVKTFSVKKSGRYISSATLKKRWLLHFVNEPVTTAEQVLKSEEKLHTLMHLSLLTKGCFTIPRGLFILSTAMKREDIDFLADKIDETLKELLPLIEERYNHLLL